MFSGLRVLNFWIKKHCETWTWEMGHDRERAEIAKFGNVVYKRERERERVTSYTRERDIVRT